MPKNEPGVYADKALRGCSNGLGIFLKILILLRLAESAVLNTFLKYIIIPSKNTTN